MGYLSDEAKELNGTPHRLPTSVAAVSLWKVKGGDYSNAEKLTFFFDDAANAAEFERKNSHPPECPLSFDLTNEEMSNLYPIEEYGIDVPDLGKPQ